jgi:hypothetical protein
VEVSSDAGKTWAQARFVDRPVRFAWRRWEYEWAVPGQPGSHTLMSRAVDSRGAAQPVEHNRDMGGYAIHHVLPVHVNAA